MKSPISWIGSKRLLAPHIVKALPEHTIYVEPFAGSIAVLLEKPRAKKEIINDANSDLITFYRVVRHHKEALIRYLEHIPNSRKAFDDFLQHRGLTDIQRAARWYVRNKLSFGAKGQHFSLNIGMSGNAFASRSNRIAKIDALNQRLDSIAIECNDWRVMFKRYDNAETLFFVDPPYTEGTQYRGLDFTIEDHNALAETLHSISGRFVLTYNDDPLYPEHT